MEPSLRLVGINAYFVIMIPDHPLPQYCTFLRSRWGYCMHPSKEAHPCMGQTIIGQSDGYKCSQIVGVWQ